MVDLDSPVRGLSYGSPSADKNQIAPCAHDANNPSRNVAFCQARSLATKQDPDICSQSALGFSVKHVVEEILEAKKVGTRSHQRQRNPTLRSRNLAVGSNLIKLFGRAAAIDREATEDDKKDRSCLSHGAHHPTKNHRSCARRSTPGIIGIPEADLITANLQAMAVRPFASASASSFSDGPLGVFSPRSHCETVVGETFKW